MIFLEVNTSTGGR